MTDTDVSGRRNDRLSFFSSAPFRWGLAFAVLLIAFEFVFFPPEYQGTIFLRHWYAGSYGRLLIFCALSGLSILLTILFFWAAFATRTIYRIFFFLTFAVLTMIEYGFYRAFDRFSRLVDVATALTGVDVSMAGNAIANYFNWIALLPIIVFAAALVVTRKKGERAAVAAGLTGLSLLLFFSLSTYFTSNLFYAPSTLNAMRTAVSYPFGWYIGTVNGPPEGLAYGSPRDALTYTATEAPKNNIVFIVDESIRGDRLSINGYQKPTTPTLIELDKKGVVANWGIASSGGTCSRLSNMMLLTGLNKLPDRSFAVYQMPTIFQYAGAMGYRNYYFDGQTNLLWNAKESDIPDLGTWIKADEIAQNAPRKYDRDTEIARRVKQIVDGSTGNFVIVNKFGLHPPYENSFPNDNYDPDSKTMPEGYMSQPVSELERLYDSALSYNLESFFSTLFSEMPRLDTIYLYTSDHGQSLEGGGRATHCYESIAEATVPLMLIADQSNLKNIDTGYRASHFNIFATLLDLMQYPEPERKYAYSISLLKAKRADSAPRFFYTDDLQTARVHPFDTAP